MAFSLFRHNPLIGIQLQTNRPDILSLSTFDRLKPIKVLIHGFGGNGTSDRFASKARACKYSILIVFYRMRLTALGTNWLLCLHQQPILH